MLAVIYVYRYFAGRSLLVIIIQLQNGRNLSTKCCCSEKMLSVRLINVARIDDDNFWSVNLLNRYRGYIQLRFVSYEWTCSCLSLVIRCTSLGKIGCCERKLSMSSFAARVTSTPKSKAFFLFSWEQKTQLMQVTCVKSEIVFFFLGYS